MAGRHLNQIDLANRWNISHRTLERWRWTGTGPAFLKLGGRVVYRSEDVEAFEAGHLCRHLKMAPVAPRRLTATPPTARPGTISRRPA
ncbi:MAG: hypothetical protein CVT82_10450 [Alphaproteobacteria bacterium HGW-Alphaproteobacteria-4]|jgi:hypothetical protein|nr:MAG: hypothetical protein CVT82_10450 [Alphaproteobacteria bacterium HGW-Alphaproteobacteria-4]